MLVSKRWLRTHVELFDTSVVLTYIDPVTNTEQVREEIPVHHVLIAPNSPLAPAALKDSSWRIKDGDTGLHFCLLVLFVADQRTRASSDVDQQVRCNGMAEHDQDNSRCTEKVEL